MHAEQLKKLLSQVKTGKVTIDEAVAKLRHLPFENLGFAHIDHHRQIRCGLPEVIYCPGKTTDQIIKIFSALAEKGNHLLATKAEQSVFDALAKTKKFPKARYEKSARAIVLEQKKVRHSQTVLPIVTAGTSDLPVAAEGGASPGGHSQDGGRADETVLSAHAGGPHRTPF